MGAPERLDVPPQLEHSLVLPFDRIGPGMLALVGGKAANLGELTRAGLPVPSGFCLTTEAYRLGTAHAGGKLSRILDDIARTPPGDSAALAGLAKESRAALLEMPMPAEVTAAVSDAYRKLGDKTPVAVRSSATAEDLPFASFAGQQDTYLNVVGRDAVLDAVHRCWASLWTDRAVAYRATNSIDPRTVRLAVVVQRMVDAAIAGVLFTANPVTGRRRQAVIDASPGLGEAVVSGAVNPDHFVVDTMRGEILERRLGDKRFSVRPLPGGGTEHVERPAAADAACVSDEQILALAALGDRVETHYGAPQDTEWAIDARGALWLTQARPITTLFPLPANAPPRDDDLRVYFCFSLAQGLERPITPMGLAVFRLMSTSASEMFGFPIANPRAGAMRYVEAGERFFIDITSVLRSRVGRAIVPRVLDVMEARSAVVLRGLFDDPRLSIINPSRLSFARRVARIAGRYRVPARAIRAAIDPASAQRGAARIGEELARQLTTSATATPAERLRFVEENLLHGSVDLLPRLVPGVLVGFGLLGLAGKVLGPDVRAGELETVLRGLPHNVTTEMDLALWALADRIRADATAAAALRESATDELAKRYLAGGLPEPAQSALSDFLARYGHRAVAEIDVGMPRWSDDPQYVLGVLANYLRLENPDAAPDALFARRAAEAEAMIESLAARAGRRSRLRARFVRFALRRARALAGLRELPKYYIIVKIAAVRRELAKVGAELAARRIIESGDDVFFVDLDDARAGLGGRDLRETVAQRRAIYEAELRRRHVPRVVLSDGTEPEATMITAVPSDGSLAGTPASAGSVTGPARVILDPVGARLEPGEILVAPSTDPGWTPLFLTAGGLVMEMGGANSHGAVVAREYGIPAVVGVANATARITTGQTITVDGSAGMVSTQ